MSPPRTGRWEGHQGVDYTVVMAPGENTENASISIHTGDMKDDDALAVRIRDLLNGETPAVRLVPVGNVWINPAAVAMIGDNAVAAPAGLTRLTSPDEAVSILLVNGFRILAPGTPEELAAKLEGTGA